jgi:hypothetical protein
MRCKNKAKGKGKGKVFPVLNEVPRHEDILRLVKHNNVKTYWGVEA